MSMSRAAAPQSTLQRTSATPHSPTDRWLWLATGALLVIGLGTAQLAGRVGDARTGIAPDAVRQGAYALLGVAAMIACARIDYRWFQRSAAAGYALALAALLLVLLIGSAQYGARRWFGSGGLTVQPSELAKPLIAFALAAYMSGRTPRLGAIALSGGLIALCLMAIALEPDLGSTLVFAAMWFGALVAWGVPWQTLTGLSAAGIGIGPLVFAIAMPAYQRERLAVFFDPAHDPLGSGFNVRQAELAIGSGGLAGHGTLADGTSQLTHVAARASDFVFALLGEQIGFIGVLVVLVLFAILALRGFEAARRAPDAFGQLLAVVLTSGLCAQAALNIAVALRLFPVTGIPLPFISQGGSALLGACISVGVLQSIAMRGARATETRWLR